MSEARQEIHIVMDAGFPRWARLDRTQALDDARNLIVKTYKDMEHYQGKEHVAKMLGLMPPDSSHVIVWWSNRVPPELRVDIRTIVLRPLEDFPELERE